MNLAIKYLLAGVGLAHALTECPEGYEEFHKDDGKRSCRRVVVSEDSFDLPEFEYTKTQGYCRGADGASVPGTVKAHQKVSLEDCKFFCNDNSDCKAIEYQSWQKSCYVNTADGITGNGNEYAECHLKVIPGAEPVAATTKMDASMMKTMYGQGCAVMSVEHTNGPLGQYPHFSYECMGYQVGDSSWGFEADGKRITLKQDGMIQVRNGEIIWEGQLAMWGRPNSPLYDQEENTRVIGHGRRGNRKEGPGQYEVGDLLFGPGMYEMPTPMPEEPAPTPVKMDASMMEMMYGQGCAVMSVEHSQGPEALGQYPHFSYECMGYQVGNPTWGFDGEKLTDLRQRKMIQVRNGQVIWEGFMKMWARPNSPLYDQDENTRVIGHGRRGDNQKGPGQYEVGDLLFGPGMYVPPPDYSQGCAVMSVEHTNGPLGQYPHFSYECMGYQVGNSTWGFDGDKLTDLRQRGMIQVRNGQVIWEGYMKMWARPNSPLYDQEENTGVIGHGRRGSKQEGPGQYEVGDLLFGPGMYHNMTMNYTMSNHTMTNHTMSNYTMVNYTMTNHTMYNYTELNYTMPNMTMSNHTMYNYTELNYTMPNMTMSNYTISNRTGEQMPTPMPKPMPEGEWMEEEWIVEEPMMMGGWGEFTELYETDYEMMTYFQSIQHLVQDYYGWVTYLFRPLRYQSQVVAGTNFIVIFQTDHGEIEVTVWRRLDGTSEVTNVVNLSGDAPSDWEEEHEWEEEHRWTEEEEERSRFEHDIIGNDEFGFHHQLGAWKGDLMMMLETQIQWRVNKRLEKIHNGDLDCDRWDWD